MIFVILILFYFLIFIISTKAKLNNTCYLICCTIFVLMIGLRGYDNGSVDTLNYVRYFLGMQAEYNYDSRGMEIGLVYYNKFLSFFHLGGTMYLTICALVSLAPVFYLVKKFSSNPYLAFLYFVAFFDSVHAMYFICLRQILGMACCIWGIILFVNNVKYRYIYYFALALLGWLFHSVSPLLSLAFFFLYYVKIPRIIYLSIVIISYVVGVLVGLMTNLSSFIVIFGLFPDIFGRLSNYADVIQDGSLLGFWGAIKYNVLGMLFSLYAPKEESDTIFSRLCIIGIILYNMFSFFGEIYRLAGIFLLFGIIAYPSIYGGKKSSIRMSFIKKIVFYVILVYGVYSSASHYYLSSELGHFSGNETLVPYQFFWEDSYKY